MKKSILFAGILIFAATFMQSCKKNYTCQCSKTYTTGNGTTTSKYSVYTYDDTQKRAIDRCNSNDTQGTDLFGNYTINCAIQ